MKFLGKVILGYARCHELNPIFRRTLKSQKGVIGVSSKMRKTICITPLSSDNPYQRLFIEELQKKNYNILTTSTLAEVFSKVWQKENKIDILHMHWLNVGQQPIGLLLNIRRILGLFGRLLWLRFKGIHLIWTVHNYTPHECAMPKLEYIKRFCVSRVFHRLLVHSEPARGFIAKKWLLNPKKVAIVPHPHYIDVYPNTASRCEALARLGLNTKRTKFLLLGAIRRYKRVPYLIRSFAQISYLDLDLLIAGRVHPCDTGLLEGIDSVVSETPHVYLYNQFIPEEQIQVFMAVADAIVFPYDDTLCSGSAILAMSFGKACIVPHAISFHSILDDAGAFFFDRSKSGSLTDALSLAASRRDYLEQMGQYNRRRIRSMSAVHCTEELVSVYSVLSSS